MSAASTAPQGVQSVRIVSSKTGFLVLATEGDAQRYVSRFPPSVSGGMQWFETPILRCESQA